MKQRHSTSDAGNSIGARQTAQSMRHEATISDARTNVPREDASPTQALTVGGNGKDGTLSVLTAEDRSKPMARSVDSDQRTASPAALAQTIGHVMTPVWRIPTGVAVPNLEAFDNVMRRYMESHAVASGVLAIARNGRLVLARGYTFAEPNGTTTLPTSLFRIASCSKTITFLAALQLIERGIVDKDATVQSILNLKTPSGQDPAGEYLNTTVGHLIRHQSGYRGAVKDDIEIAAAFDNQLPVTKQQHASYITTLPWVKPGVRVYSNYDYMLLGMVIEKLQPGFSYIEYAKEHIFLPLGALRPRLGHSKETDAAPSEMHYDDSANQFGPSVLENSRPLVPFPYGVGNLENADSFGGWILTAIDFVRLFCTFDQGIHNPLLANPSE
ncbi:MAG: serine hydrolase domain-containing protein, partial [Gammaproteobacteria bacterium]